MSVSTDVLGETHPIQMPHTSYAQRSEGARLSKAVTMRAYEVYCHLYGPQEALVTGGCRGGLGLGELTAFLYARSFPQTEWRQRTDEAFKGMKNFA